MKFTIALSLAALLGSVSAAPVERAMANVLVPGDESTIIFTDGDQFECRDYSNPTEPDEYEKIMVCRPTPSAMPFLARSMIPGGDDWRERITHVAWSWQGLYEKMCDGPAGCGGFDAWQAQYPLHEEWQKSVTYTKYPSNEYDGLLAPLSDFSWGYKGTPMKRKSE